MGSERPTTAPLTDTSDRLRLLRHAPN